MTKILHTTCCIAGGGPAGMMLGFLLTRMGVDTIILEKHADFLRDFRGDTIHPSTLELMHELGLLDEFLQRPHQAVFEINAQTAGEAIPIADFRHLPTHCKFLVFMPQWEFLNFLTEHAVRFPSFHLMMQSEVTGLVQEQGSVVGVHATTTEGPLEVRATLTIGADGRHSIVRSSAGLEVIKLGAPMDVLWMALSRRSDDPAKTGGYFNAGRIFVMMNREDYWQCAFLIPKGSLEQFKGRGIHVLQEEITRQAPFLQDRVSEMKDWNDVRLLTVSVDRLSRWYQSGLLCIGDAAHAMSPIGGVGINLAIQDAVAAANLLGTRLRNGSVTIGVLRQVQQRRKFPTRATQSIQLIAQNRIIRPMLLGARSTALPWPLRLLRRYPCLRRIPARAIGLGFLPEHIETPAIFSPAQRVEHSS